MPGPYSITKQAALAAAIDKFLGTTEAQTDAVLRDLVLGWSTALIAKLNVSEAAIAALQSQTTLLTTQVSILQAQMGKLLGTG